MIKITLALLGIIATLFLTTWLLDWNFIQARIAREILIYLILILEGALGVALVRSLLKSI